MKRNSVWYCKMCVIFQKRSSKLIKQKKLVDKLFKYLRLKEQNTKSSKNTKGRKLAIKNCFGNVFLPICILGLEGKYLFYLFSWFIAFQVRCCLPSELKEQYKKKHKRFSFYSAKMKKISVLCFFLFFVCEESWCRHTVPFAFI